MEVRTAGSSSNFARLSSDLFAYKASESDLEVNESLSSYPRMHLSSSEGHNNRSGQASTYKAATMKYDRRQTSAGHGPTAIGDSARLWPQGQELRNNAFSSSVSAHSALRRGPSTNRSPTAGDVRTTSLVKSISGFGFTLADTPRGQMIKLMAETLGHSQLRPGDVIVMIDGVDVRRQSHENVITMLKSCPPGSTVRFSFVRPNGDRGPHSRPHSAIPGSSLYSGSSLLQPSSINGGAGGGRGGGGGAEGSVWTAGEIGETGGTEQTGRHSALDYKTINNRMLPTHSEVNPGDPNGTALSRTTNHHPRTVSFGNSTDAADVATKAGNAGRSVSKEGRHDSRRFTGILRRAVTPRRSTPVHGHQEIQKQYWMSLTSSSSNLNFSGTPDFIPASLYRPSSSSENDELIRFRQDQLLTDASANADDKSKIPRVEIDAMASSSFGATGPSTASAKRQVTEVSNARGNSLPAESNSFQMKSSDIDNRLQQMTVANYQELPNSSHPVHRSENRRSSSDRTKINGEVNINERSSFLETVDQSLLYNADIHRGSRGFGFSIRGGKEFNGMPLLVLDIAEGGPAYMDGRMKNGDQILSINGFSTREMTHERAIELIQNACSPISLVMKRASSSGKRHSNHVRAGGNNSGKAHVEFNITSDR